MIRNNSVFGHFSRSDTQRLSRGVLSSCIKTSSAILHASFFYELSIYEPKKAPTNTRFLSLNKTLKEISYVLIATVNIYTAFF